MRKEFAQTAGRYRKKGLDALTPKKQPGAKAKLTPSQQQELCAMFDDGPKREEGLAELEAELAVREYLEEAGMPFDTHEMEVPFDSH